VNTFRIVGIVLIVGGVLALILGGFSWTEDTQKARIGPIELSVKERKTVNVPVWAGIAAIVVGGALLAFGGKKS
jgi:uncharacterized membrane protein HdeD (DUF308 family)